MTELDNIFKALRLVPEFDGNSNVLPRFISLCDQLVQEFISNNPDSNLINIALANGILNKVTGSAARLINTSGIPSDWSGIRKSLINNFSDQRDETALYNDLSLLTQGSNTPQEFYERCQNLFSTIMTYITLHEEIGTTIEAKRKLYQKLTLQAFLRGLKDPLGSRIRCMRPDTIEKALEFVQDELNTMYLQARNEPDRTKHPQIFSSQPFKVNNFNNNIPQVKPHFQSNPPYRSNFITNPQTLHRQHLGPSRTQQIFRAQPPNYNPHNAFKITPRNAPPQFNSTSQTARPMSGVSHFVPRNLPPTRYIPGHDWSKHGNPPPSNYFKTREMNFHDSDYYDQYYDNSYYDYYDDNEYYNYNDYYYGNPYYDSEPPQEPSQNCEPIIEEPSSKNKEDFQQVKILDKPK